MAKQRDGKWILGKLRDAYDAIREVNEELEHREVRELTLSITETQVHRIADYDQVISDELDAIKVRLGI